MNLLKSDFLKRWHKSLSKKFNWYHRWEKYKYSQRLHLSFFFIFLLIIAVSVILPYNPFSSKAINPLVPQAPKYLQANPGDGLMGLTWFWDDKEDVYKSRYEISYLRYPSLAEVPRDPNNKDRCNPSPSQKTTPAGVISNSSNPYTFRATNITGLNNNYYYCFYVQAKSTPSSAPAWTVASNPASPRAINKNNPTEFKQSPIGSPLILMVSDTANFYEVKSGNGELYPGSNVAKYPIQDPAREFDAKYTREQRLDAALENLLVYKDQDGNPKDWMFDSILLAPYDFVNGNWSRKDPTKENIDKLINNQFFGPATGTSGFLTRLNNIIEKNKAKLGNRAKPIKITFGTPLPDHFLEDDKKLCGVTTTGTIDARLNPLCVGTDVNRKMNTVVVEDLYNYYLNNLYQRWQQEDSRNVIFRNNFDIAGVYYSTEKVSPTGYPGRYNSLRIINRFLEAKNKESAYLSNAQYLIHIPYTQGVGVSSSYGSDLSRLFVYVQPNNFSDSRYGTGVNGHIPGSAYVDRAIDQAKTAGFGLELELNIFGSTNISDNKRIMSWGDNYYDLKDGETLDASGRPVGEVLDLNHYNSIYSTDKNISPFWYYIQRAKETGLAGQAGKGSVIFENGGNLAVLANSHQYKYRKYYDMMYSYLNYRPTPGVQTVQSVNTATTSSRNGVVIKYTTNTPTNLRLVYGTATSGKLSRELNDSFYTATRTVTITGLAPGTKYNVKMTGTDLSGKPTLSRNLAFTTLK